MEELGEVVKYFKLDFIKLCISMNIFLAEKFLNKV